MPLRKSCRHQLHAHASESQIASQFISNLIQIIIHMQPILNTCSQIISHIQTIINTYSQFGSHKAAFTITRSVTVSEIIRYEITIEGFVPFHVCQTLTSSLVLEWALCAGFLRLSETCVQGWKKLHVGKFACQQNSQS